MSFTGEAVRQGTADRFGVGDPGSTPRAFASFRGEPYVITRDVLVHITDLANGSGVVVQNNAEYNLSDPDPTCAFVYNDRLYFLNRADDILAVFDDPLTGDAGIIGFYSSTLSAPAAAATDGTTVWIVNALTSGHSMWTIDPTDASTAVQGVINFEGSGTHNVAGMFYYDGSLYLLDNGTERMFVVDDLNAASFEAAIVDASITEFGVGQVGVNGGGVHDNEAYMAGGSPDALYRFYNVRWDETITNPETDEGDSETLLDLSTVSQDAASFALQGTNPSWVSVSGNNLIATNAPAVDTDTDYDVGVRATRDGVNVDKTIQVTVRDTTQTPTNTAPSFAQSSYSFDDVAIAVNTVVGTVAATDADNNTLSYSLTGADASDFAIDADGEITVATALMNSQVYNFNVVADDGTDTTDVGVTVTATVALSTEPQSLTVEFPSATTALIQFSQPTNLGGTLQTYEISVNSGTYFDVKSTSGRYLISGLTRGTDQTFDVRAKRADGTTGSAAQVTGRTPIASLHNTLFFRDCVNLRDDGERITEHGDSTNILRAAADNDLETFTTETDIDIDISDGTDATRVDAVLVISEGVTRYEGVATGGTGSGWTARTIPDSVENWEGATVSTVIDGVQYDLYLLDTHFTATSVQVTFTGSNIKVYEVMLLEFGLELDANGDFTEINPDKVDRTAVLHQGVTGSIERETGIGEREKWETDFAAKFVAGRTEIEQSDVFLKWRENNLNFVFAQEYSRYPARVYPASFMLTRVPVRLRGNDKNLGDVVQFKIGER